jgi:hypothetical protein
MRPDSSKRRTLDFALAARRGCRIKPSRKPAPSPRKYAPERLGATGSEPSAGARRDDGRFRSPTSEPLQRARRGFMRHPPSHAVVTGISSEAPPFRRERRSPARSPSVQRAWERDTLRGTPLPSSISRGASSNASAVAACHAGKASATRRRLTGSGQVSAKRSEQVRDPGCGPPGAVGLHRAVVDLATNLV